MRKRFLWASLMGLVAVFTLAGVSTAQSDRNEARAQVLRYALGSEPPSLDPGLATDTTSSSIINNIMEPLIRLGAPPQLKALPGAAQSWRVRGRNVTLNLRRNVRWTNGQPTTAGDYVWAWLRTISPELGADYAYQFYGIAGAQAYNECKSNCGALRSRVGIRAIGRWRLQIRLTSPQPWFIQQLSHTSFLPVHRRTVQRHGKNWTEPGNIVTNGPFRLASWAHNSRVVLVKNTRYRAARSVRLARIEMPIIVDQATATNAFEAGNIDACEACVPTAQVPRWRRTQFWKSWPAIGTYYYGFNVRNIPDVNQRRAMAFATDRHQITRYITQSGQVPARGWTPNSLTGAPTILKNATLPARANKARARQFMSRVRNPKRDVRLFMNNVRAHVNIATAVQAMWKELGLDVTLRVMEWAQYLQFLGPPPNSEVDVYRLGWIYDFPDAYNGFVLWLSDSGNNNTNWKNARYDRLVKQAERTPNVQRRVRIYQQLENILTGPSGQLPIMPIYWYNFNALVKTYVKGYRIMPTHQIDFTKVRITTS
ncbi:MAG TPA: peptide ABC transporter substrate-binding protein [Gaiellaceae bacterium]|nr:peptide ABC transporter substrate-binding protein [Gaiellaceae bacterium]